MATIDIIVLSILAIVALVFIWSKFSEPLKKFWDLIRGAFSSGKEKTYQTYDRGKEIVYDI